MSKKAFEKIKNAFFLPFLEIRNHGSLKKNHNFSYFLILRKEVHLIFESICKKKVVFNDFEKIEHLLAKDIFLSLHNIEEAINSRLVRVLEDEKMKFREHFLTCSVRLLGMFEECKNLSFLWS